MCLGRCLGTAGDSPTAALRAGNSDISDEPLWLAQAWTKHFISGTFAVLNVQRGERAHTWLSA